MKSILVLVLLLAGGYTTIAQRVYRDTGTSRMLPQPPQYRHCGATRTGEGMMIAGGVVLAIGGVIALTNIGVVEHKEPSTGDVFGFILAGAGGSIAFYGVIVFLLGKNYEAHHRDRFSIISNGNTVGLAYHF